MSRLAARIRLNLEVNRADQLPFLKRFEVEEMLEFLKDYATEVREQRGATQHWR